METIVYIIIFILITIISYFLLQPRKPKLYVVTVITDSTNENYLRLLNSSLLKGINFIPLITNIPVGHGKGFGMKIKLVNNFLKTRDDNDIVMFIDGYDVLLQGTTAEILDRWKKFQYKHGRGCALFSAEYFCWPNASLEEQYPSFTETPYKFLNSGTYIGNVDTLKKIINKTNLNLNSDDFNNIDDQLFFTDIYLNNKNLIVLDHYNSIFNCMAGACDDLEYRGQWYNKKTNTYPLVFHGNGNDGKEFLFKEIYPTI